MQLHLKEIYLFILVISFLLRISIVWTERYLAIENMTWINFNFKHEILRNTRNKLVNIDWILVILHIFSPNIPKCLDYLEIIPRIQWYFHRNINILADNWKQPTKSVNEALINSVNIPNIIEVPIHKLRYLIHEIRVMIFPESECLNREISLTVILIKIQWLQDFFDSIFSPIVESITQQENTGYCILDPTLFQHIKG